jgi:hypothetical protein
MRWETSIAFPADMLVTVIFPANTFSDGSIIPPRRLSTSTIINRLEKNRIKNIIATKRTGEQR